MIFIYRQEVLVLEQKQVRKYPLSSHRLIGLVGLLLFLVSPVSAWAASDQKKSATPAPTKRRQSPPAARKKDTKPIPLLPKKKQKEGLWTRFQKGVGEYVPSPIKEGWQGAKERWKRATELYEAMKKFAGWDEATLRKQRIAAAKRRRLEQLRSLDQKAEQRALQSLQMEVWKRACHHGSARACREWYQKDPTSVFPVLLLRDLLWRRKRWKQLMPICEALRKRYTKDISHHMCVVDGLRAQGQYKEAAKLLTELTKSHPLHGLVWLRLGRLSLRERRWKEAAAACLRATKRMPRDTKAFVCLGKALLGQKQRKASREAFTKACTGGHIDACRQVRDMRPGGLTGAWVWSKMNTRINSLRVARATRENSCRVGLRRACRGWASLLRKQAELLKLYKRPWEAEWKLRKGATLAPYDDAAWKALGLHLLKKKSWFEGCQAIKSSIKINSQQPKLWAFAGKCYERETLAGRAKAKQAFSKACALGHNRACLKINFGKPSSP